MKEEIARRRVDLRGNPLCLLTDVEFSSVVGVLMNYIPRTPPSTPSSERSL